MELRWCCWRIGFYLAGGRPAGWAVSMCCAAGLVAFLATMDPCDERRLSAARMVNA